MAIRKHLREYQLIGFSSYMKLMKKNQESWTFFVGSQANEMDKKRKFSYRNIFGHFDKHYHLDTLNKTILWIRSIQIRR